MHVTLSQNIKEILTQHLGLVILCMLLVFFSVFGQSIIFGVYLPMIRVELGMSKTYSGALYAAATIGSAIAVIYTGKKMDEWPLRYFTAITLIMLAVGCLTLSLAQGAIMLFIAFFLLRQFGQGLMCLASNTAVNRYLPPHNRGKAVALTGIGGPLHMMIFPVIFLYLGEFIDWRHMWQIFAGFIIIVLLPLFWFGLKSHQGGRHKQWLEEIEQDKKAQEASNSSSNIQRQWTRREALKDWKFYALVAVFFLSPFTGTVIFFYQADLANAVGLSPIEFATAFPIFTITSIIFSLITGVVIDKYGEKLALIIYPIFFACGLFLLNVEYGLMIVYMAMFLIGAANGIMGTLGGPLLTNIYGTVHLGAIKSAIFSCNIAASALSPFLFGYFMDLGVDILTLFFYCGLYASIIWIFAYPICKPQASKS